jgi:hypothetical protein
LFTKVRRHILLAATIAGWTVLTLDAFALLNAPGGIGRFAGCIALAGTVFWAVTAKSRPAVELWEAAYEAGRRDAQLEAATGRLSRRTRDVVVPFRRTADQ